MYKNINLLSYKDFDIVEIVKYLESIFHSSKGLSTEERKKIESFLIFVISDSNAEQAIREFLENSDISPNTLAFMQAFSYHMRHYNQLPATEVLMCIANGNWQNDASISVKQWAALNDLCELTDYVQHLDRYEIFSHNCQLQTVKEKVMFSNIINQNICRLLPHAEFFDKSLPSLDCIEKLTRQNMLLNLIHYYKKIPKHDSKYSLCEHTEETNAVDQVAEDLQSSLFAEFHKMDLTQLFTKDNQKTLQKTFGKQWRDEIALLMKALENKIYAASFLDRQLTPENASRFGDVIMQSSPTDDELFAHNGNFRYPMHKDPKMLMISSKKEQLEKIMTALKQVIHEKILNNRPLNDRGDKVSLDDIFKTDQFDELLDLRC